MRLPFGLDLISVLVGIVFAVWVLPMLMGLFRSRNTASASA